MCMSAFGLKPLKCGAEKSRERGFMPAGLHARAKTASCRKPIYMHRLFALISYIYI